MVVSDSFGCWNLQHKERAIPTLALEETKCSVIVLARMWEAAGCQPFTGELVYKLDDVVKQFSVVRLGFFQCMLKVPLIWELGARRMPSNDCITFHRFLLKGEVTEPALGDAHCTAVLGVSPDLPAGPALALQLALPAQTWQPAAVITDAESSESGEILNAGLHDGHVGLLGGAGAGLFVLAVGFCSNACRYCHAEMCGRASLTVDDWCTKILWLLMVISGAD